MSTAMTDVQNIEPERWRQNLDDYLQQACEAEAKLDYVEAARLFEQALLCEARIRPDVTDLIAYVFSVRPLYFWFGCWGPIRTCGNK